MKLNKPTFVVSTRANNLVEALRKSSQIVTVWVRTGKFKDRLPLIRSAITYETKSAVDAKDYVKRFVAAFCPPKSHIKLSILRGISKNQITQLLSYTKRDFQIKQYTHDSERFKNTKTFAAWKRRKKTIYTLISRKGKLLGIIWFSRKHFKNYKNTLAIRLYPPVRGMGLSKKFLGEVYTDFRKRHKNSRLWLRTSKDNPRALKLYHDFGFRTILRDKKNNEEIMVFKN